MHSVLVFSFIFVYTHAVTAGAVTKDTLQHWSDVTSQPISLVASCYALEQLKLLSEHSGVEGGKSARHFIAEQKLEVQSCLLWQSMLWHTGGCMSAVK